MGIEASTVSNMRRRTSLLMVVVVPTLALALIVGARIESLGEGSKPRAGSSSLPELPPGPPRVVPGTATVGRATLADMIVAADTVFLGRVGEIGGSEVVSPEGVDGPQLTRHRVRFSIDRPFRGTSAQLIDLSLLDVEELSYEFQVGQSYLVFANHAELGYLKTPALVPVGYRQGIYTVTSDAATARNAINGDIDLSRLASRLGAAGG